MFNACTCIACMWNLRNPCQCCNCKTVILTGSLTKLAQAEPNFALFEKLYGIHYIIPENATFATAIGAALIGR